MPLAPGARQLGQTYPHIPCACPDILTPQLILHSNTYSLFMQTNILYSLYVPGTVLKPWGIRQRWSLPLGADIQEYGINNQLVNCLTTTINVLQGLLSC